MKKIGTPLANGLTVNRIIQVSPTVSRREMRAYFAVIQIDFFTCESPRELILSWTPYFYLQVSLRFIAPVDIWLRYKVPHRYHLVTALSLNHTTLLARIAVLQLRYIYSEG